VQIELTFRSEDGKETTGSGDLTRSSRTRRVVFTAAFAVGGLLFGLATLVPGPHMCVTWVFPFVGAFLALRSWWNEAELNAITGACPACDEAEIKLRGGQLNGDKPLRRVCPRCVGKLEVVCLTPPPP
jgi:hypothetical protein